MKYVYPVLLYLICTQPAAAQDFSLGELLNMAGISTGKFQQYAAKKGFHTETQQKDYIRMLYTRDTTRSYYITRQLSEDGGYLGLEKLTVDEYATLKKTMQQEGFVMGTLKAKVQTEIFEKGPLTITATSEIDLEEGRRFYNLILNRKNLPKVKEIQFAEDLLQIDSHLQLVHVFGQSNIVKDEFIQADGSTLPCSVLFPYSPSEAVFVWKDRANYRSLEAIRIGGNPNTKKSLKYDWAVEQNRWVSKQGVFPSMSLDRLCSLNEAPIQFYGWGNRKSGSLVPDSKGKLDFSQLGFIFSCFNCNDDKYYGDRAHNATEALNENRKIYVATMVIKPRTQP